MLPKLSNAKVEGGIFTAPQIREMVVPTKRKVRLDKFSESIVFPLITWFYDSANVIIRDWGCGFDNRREDIVAWSDNRASFTVLGFMAVVAYCRDI
jgi:hypothetical protein